MNTNEPTHTVPEFAWMKSSYSSGAGGECVEVAACSDTIHIRDSKDEEGAILSLIPDSWTAFVKYAAQS
jgi:hypothetical protein